MAYAGNLPTLFTGSRLPSSFGFNSLQPGTFPGPTVYSSPGTVASDPFGTLTNAGCNLISNPTLRALCIAAGGVLSGGLGGGGNNGGGGGGLVAPVQCPPGYVSDGAGGCKLGGLAPMIPGDIGRQDFGWQAVNGRYGAGVTPIAVARTRRECPAGYSLGKDNICYDRIRKGDRKWNPGTKPFLSGGEVNAIRRAKRLRKKFARLSSGSSALFPTAKKCAPKKGRKR